MSSIDSIRAASGKIVDLLASKKYYEIEKMTRGVRLSAQDIMEIISSYNVDISPADERLYQNIDIIKFENTQEPTYSVVVTCIPTKRGYPTFLWK